MRPGHRDRSSHSVMALHSVSHFTDLTDADFTAVKSTRINSIWKSLLRSCYSIYNTQKNKKIHFLTGNHPPRRRRSQSLYYNPILKLQSPKSFFLKNVFFFLNSYTYRECAGNVHKIIGGASFISFHQRR